MLNSDEKTGEDVWNPRSAARTRKPEAVQNQLALKHYERVLTQDGRAGRPSPVMSTYTAGPCVSQAFLKDVQQILSFMTALSLKMYGDLHNLVRRNIPLNVNYWQ